MSSVSSPNMFFDFVISAENHLLVKQLRRAQ
jgi:hypothetical protein